MADGNLPEEPPKDSEEDLYFGPDDYAAPVVSDSKDDEPSTSEETQPSDDGSHTDIEDEEQDDIEFYDDEEYEYEDEEGGLPIWLLVIPAVVGLIVGIVGIGAYFLFIGGYTSLNAANPTFSTPEGVIVNLLDGTQPARIKLQASLLETNQWNDARTVFPADLTPLTPVFTTQVRGQGSVSIDFPVQSPDLSLVDVYSWNKQSGLWEFVPSHPSGDRRIVIVQPSDGPLNLVVVQRTPAGPFVAVIVSPDTPDAGINADIALVKGLSIDGSGALQGTPASSSAPQILTVIENRSGGFGAYADPTQQEAIISQLTPYLDSSAGIVLDFLPGDGFADFAAALNEQAFSRGKRVDVLIRTPEYDAYDVAALGDVANTIWLEGESNPFSYLPSGGTYETVNRLVGDANRGQAALIVEVGNVEVGTDGAIRTVTLDEAANVFGEIRAVEGYLEGDALPANVDLPLRLSGNVDALAYDNSLGQNFLTYVDDSGTSRTIYFVSPLSVNNRLSIARTYGLSAVGVKVSSPSPELTQGIEAFRAQQAAASEPLELVWEVVDTGGTKVASASGDLTFIQYFLEALGKQGSYTVRALLGTEDNRAEIASLDFRAGREVGAEEAPEEEEEEEPPVIIETEEALEVEDEPTPVPTVSGSITAGIFELGGQTQTLAHPAEMQRAGMTWVKFQHKWSPGDDAAGAVGGRISAARSQGFKVLLSIPGQLDPTSIDYAGYTAFLGQVAALGPDAIEVWNEQNITREWPAGQISGINYTNNMLIPAYESIKAANPNVLVIAGAPAPTGFFGGCTPNGCDDWLFVQEMANAGAGNYMDCMGIHYNEGIISPSQRTGDPRGEFYSRYFYGMIDAYRVIGKPLCFTELGYLTPDGYGSLPGAFGWAGDTSVGEHAQWLAEAAVLASESGIVRLMIIFNVDFTVYGADPQAGYAMIRPGGGCPACDALAAVQQ